MKIEVVTYNLASVRVAQQCGATRVELCANEGAGGTSPSLALLQIIKEQCTIPVFVMVRPREGDFTYTDDEMNCILREIEMYKLAGADGFVCAALQRDGTVDAVNLSKMVKASYPLPFTFHRAFDHVPDPMAAMETIIACGCQRILTSGQQKSALDGVLLIKDLIVKAGERIIILPGAGLNAENIEQLIAQTGTQEIHLSAKKIVERDALLNSRIQLGSVTDNNSFQITDSNTLCAVVKIATKY